MRAASAAGADRPFERVFSCEYGRCCGQGSEQDESRKPNDPFHEHLG
jgi:hypothetical protein